MNVVFGTLPHSLDSLVVAIFSLPDRKGCIRLNREPRGWFEHVLLYRRGGRVGNRGSLGVDLERMVTSLASQRSVNDGDICQRQRMLTCMTPEARGVVQDLVILNALVGIGSAVTYPTPTLW